MLRVGLIIAAASGMYAIVPTHSTLVIPSALRLYYLQTTVSQERLINAVSCVQRKEAQSIQCRSSFLLGYNNSRFVCILLKFSLLHVYSSLQYMITSIYMYVYTCNSIIFTC